MPPNERNSRLKFLSARTDVSLELAAVAGLTLTVAWLQLGLAAAKGHMTELEAGPLLQHDRIEMLQ